MSRFRKAMDKTQAAYSLRLERLVRKRHKRLLEKLSTSFKGAEDDDEVDMKELSNLRDFLNKTVKVTLKIGRTRAQSEGVKDAPNSERRHDADAAPLTDLQMARAGKLLTDQQKEYVRIAQETYDEYGPNTEMLQMRLEKELNVSVGQAKTIAVTETEVIQANAYADTLEEGGYTHVTWHTSKEEHNGPCIECNDLDGEVMTIVEFRAKFPPHPSCYCWSSAYIGDFFEGA